MTHRLDPLFRPKSIAILGASDREYSFSQETLQNLTRGEFPNQINPVNPRYEELGGLKNANEILLEGSIGLACRTATRLQKTISSTRKFTENG